MVRGLKEDGSLLPVAFMDMQCYVNVVKELKGTGMCILGDALKGLWFTGYSVNTLRVLVAAISQYSAWEMTDNVERRRNHTR